MQIIVIDVGKGRQPDIYKGHFASKNTDMKYTYLFVCLFGRGIDRKGEEGLGGRDGGKGGGGKEIIED